MFDATTAQLHALSEGKAIRSTLDALASSPEEEVWLASRKSRETRQAYADGTNGFERILPGADRMYPDTDTPPLPIPDAWVDAIRVHPAERTWEKEDRYRAVGLDAFASARLAAASWSAVFDAVADAIIALARDTSVRFMIPAAEAQLQVTASEAIGTGQAWKGAKPNTAAAPARAGNPMPQASRWKAGRDGTAPAPFCRNARSLSSCSSSVTSAPPTTSEWPPRYLVVECSTTSAPRVMGRWR